jgi:hypothetical protein
MAKGGAKAQAYTFNARTVIAIGVVFGSFLVLNELGQPQFGLLLALSTGTLLMWNTGYGERLAESINRLAGKVSL